MITEKVYPQTKSYTSSQLDEPLKGKTEIFSDLSVPFQRNNDFVLLNVSVAQFTVCFSIW